MSKNQREEPFMQLALLTARKYESEYLVAVQRSRL